MSKNRNEVAENLKWRLTDIFKDAAEFDALLDKVSKIADMSAYEGKLSDKKTLLECLKRWTRSIPTSKSSTFTPI